MGLFDIFKPKTVEARYSTLLSLFRRTHKTFKITRNEKSVVEFTYGINNKGKQYWSIVQPFDTGAIYVKDNYSYDSSKIITISMHTSIDGYPVKVAKSFDPSINQAVMFNTIMQASIEEIAKAADSLYGEEIRKEIQEEEKKESLKHISKTTNNIEVKAIDNIDNNNKTNKTNILSTESASSVSIHDRNLDWEINLLTGKQKFAFLSLIIYICTQNKLEEDKFIKSLLKDLINMLGFTFDILNLAYKCNSNKEIIQYYREMNSIRMDGPFIRFLYICEAIAFASNNIDRFNLIINKVLTELNFSKEEIDDFLLKIYKYKSTYTYRFKKEQTLQKHNWETIERWDIELSSLTRTQKISLLKLAILFAQPLNGEGIITDKEYKELLTFTFVLDFNEKVLTEFLSNVSSINKDLELSVAKTICVEGPFQFFISTCTSLWELSNMEYYVCSKYVNMLESLDFTLLDINKVLHKENNYNILNKSKTIYNFIIKEWSLLGFTKKFGKMKIVKFVNENTSDSFKCCKFIQTNGTVTLVAFAKKLGGLTPQEIVERKNQLKVAKWVKGDEEGYTLYE